MNAAPFGTVRLSLDRLVTDGVIEPDLARRLRAHAEPSAIAGPLVSVLYILGALAVAAGVVALKPTAMTGLVLAVVALVGGWFVGRLADASYRVLSLGLAISGALGLAGWFALEFGDALPAIAVSGFATLTALAIAIAFRSLFLAALVPLGLGAMLGSGTVYWHASYAIFVREPTITFAAFTLLTVALVAAIDRGILAGAYARMGEVAMRVSFVIANFGLWVGSLWGDHVGEHLSGIRERVAGEPWQDRRDRLDAWREDAWLIPDDVFVLGWVGVAVAAIVWGQHVHRRFVTMGGVTFLATNAYTQFFERFHDESWALIIGGTSLVAIAVAIIRWRKKA